MRRWALVLVVLLVLSASAAPALAGPGCGQWGPFIAVGGEATLRFEPEVVRLTVGVTTLAPSAKMAAAQNAKAMSKVVAVLKKALGDSATLRTVRYRVGPRYQWDNKSRTRRLVGFKAVNLVSVSSKQVKEVGRLLDAAVAAGANTISGPYWELKDPAAARRKVLALAYADARANAQALARAAGVELGPVLTMSSTTSPEPVARMEINLRAPSAPAKPTPVEPGQLTVSASVFCRFAIKPR